LLICIYKKRISCVQTGIVDPIPDNFDNNIREPFLNTLISNIQSRFKDADIIDQLAIPDLTETDLIECMYGHWRKILVFVIYWLK
jgi:hypothetical protein